MSMYFQFTGIMQCNGLTKKTVPWINCLSYLKPFYGQRRLFFFIGKIFENLSLRFSVKPLLSLWSNHHTIKFCWNHTIANRVIKGRIYLFCKFIALCFEFQYHTKVNRLRNWMHKHQQIDRNGANTHRNMLI